jgi:hypothetical protein
MSRTRLRGSDLGKLHASRNRTAIILADSPLPGFQRHTIAPEEVHEPADGGATIPRIHFDAEDRIFDTKVPNSAIFPPFLDFHGRYLVTLLKQVSSARIGCYLTNQSGTHYLIYRKN